MGHLSQRFFTAEIDASVHPFSLSKQTISKEFGIPELATDYSGLGGATSLSFVCLSKFLEIYIRSPWLETGPRHTGLNQYGCTGRTRELPFTPLRRYDEPFACTGKGRGLAKLHEEEVSVRTVHSILVAEQTTQGSKGSSTWKEYWIRIPRRRKGS